MEDKYKYLSDEELNQLIKETQKVITYLNCEKYRRIDKNFQSSIGKYYKFVMENFIVAFKVIDIRDNEFQTICFTVDLSDLRGGKEVKFYNPYPITEISTYIEINKDEYEELLEFALKEAKDICDSRIN